MTTFLILIIVFAGYLIWIYNTLVKLKIRVQEAWSSIEVQMKRRYNLILSLVETVKGYAKHEDQTLKRVIEYRNSAMNASGSPHDQAVAENKLAGTLRSFFALGESYPDLKANQNYLELQQELTDTEDKIQESRRLYNSNVMQLNIMTEQFPSNIIASVFHFEKKEFFELENAEALARKPVEMEFDNKEL